jgi:hypothetical protein
MRVHGGETTLDWYHLTDIQELGDQRAIERKHEFTGVHSRRGQRLGPSADRSCGDPLDTRAGSIAKQKESKTRPGSEVRAGISSSRRLLIFRVISPRQYHPVCLHV